MRANVHYNDYKGSAAADIADFLILNDFLKAKGFDAERYHAVGVDFSTGNNRCSYRFICEDKILDNKLVSLDVEEDMSFDEFFSMFKMFNVVLTWNGAYEESDIEE